MQPRAALGPQTSSSSSGKQVVELNGYVIILVEGRDGKIKLYGSPADKDNLEVADEILDVNERKLEDLPRTEVIRHIHECIQSCMIKLRVKRRSDSRLAGELGNAVQDAFVIAVEQQARERLQRLSALKRVTPVDMSQLSIKLNQQNHTKGGQTTTQDLSFLKEASPIYVTSLTSNHITAGTSTLTTATASAATVSSATSASVSSQIVAPVNTSSIIADSYVITAPISTSNINNNNTTTTDTTIQPIANQQQQQQQQHQQQQQQQSLAIVGSPPLSSNSKPIGYQTTTAVVSSSNLSSAISLATNGPSSTSDSKLLTSCAKRVDNNLSGDDKSICHNQISNSNTNYSAVNNSISGSSAILPNIIPATGPSNITITGISSSVSGGQKIPIITNISGSDVISSATTHYTQPIVVGGSVSGNTDSSLTSSSVTNFKHQQASTNNQLYNYSSLSNNTSSINNNNNLLINNLCNNNNSNNISNCGAGNTLNSFNAYGTSNCDLLLANGHPPKRELSTLSEGDSEPLDDNNGTSLYDHQQQLSNSNSSISKGRTELLLGDQSLRQDTRQRRRSGSSIVVIDGEDLKPCLPDDYISSHHIHHQRSDSKDLDKEMLTMLSVNQDNGPHREMAVDVPDTFIARNKTPPRYPPPRPPVQLNGSVKPVPPPRDHLRMEKDGRLVNRAPAPQVPDRKISPSITGTPNHQIAQIVEPTVEQMDSIKKYQEQLRRRREEEERIAQQNEFLRASLRGSRKLQALQDGPLPQQQTPIDRTSIGVDNDAYTDDEEVEKIIGYGELVAALTRLQNQLSKNGMAALAGRVTAAQNLLLGPGMAHALAARTAVLQRRRPRTSNPVCSNAQQLSKDVVEILAQSNSTAAIELGNLLTTHEMEGLLHAHDRVASVTDRTPSIIGSHSASSTLSSQRIQPNPPSSHHLVNNNILKRPEAQLSTQFGVLSDGSQDHIRIIQIEKSSEPLGATVRNEGEAVVIGRIVRGGAAEKSGLLHEGDEILEVNGIEMRGKTVNDVCALLGAMTGTLTFLIVPAGTPPPGGGRDSAVLHVRAHFDYDPEDDLYIPCRELGISFQKGDVLHVISRDDPNWWQAYREGEEDQTLAGLIPSQSFQHQRETMKLAIAEEAGLARNRGKESSKGATLLCARKGRKKKKKASSEAGYPLYATTAPDEPDPEEILTYEEVALYYPRATHKRPIVLIGPPNIGRHELRQRLMADSDRFAAAVPHTSRPRRDGEVPGQDYHFITRAQFEADILARKFVEHGEYEKAYYGTSLEAIRTVVASGKICVLNLHPQSLKLLRASDLKPYVVLVAPPSLEKLRQKKLRNGEPFKEEELKEIIATARDMEARWGHLFDMIIINNDTERAYHQLLAEINSLEREPQWVPASWVHNNRDES